MATDPKDLDQEQYIAFALDEVRQLKEGAIKANSWSAVDRLQRQERELMRELHDLQADNSDGISLDAEDAFSQLVLPEVSTWPRAFIEKMYLHCAGLLGVLVDA